MLDTKYVAGFFDGDGSVGVYVDRHKGKGRSANDMDKYHLRVNVCNQNKPLLLKFMELWGGNVNRQSRAYVWAIGANRALKFLKDILPYVVNKRDQVELAIGFQTNRTHTHRANRSDPEYGKSVSDKLKYLKRVHRDLFFKYVPLENVCKAGWTT